jgi:hypothetical protein
VCPVSDLRANLRPPSRPQVLRFAGFPHYNKDCKHTFFFLSSPAWGYPTRTGPPLSIAPTQVMPNGWRIIVGFLALCWSIDVPPLLAVFWRLGFHCAPRRRPAHELEASTGAICVYARTLEARMPVLLHGFFCEALAHFGIAPTQVMPNRCASCRASLPMPVYRRAALVRGVPALLPAAHLHAKSGKRLVLFRIQGQGQLRFALHGMPIAVRIFVFAASEVGPGAI